MRVERDPGSGGFIRERRKVGGDVVYDASVGSVHLGTFAARLEAERILRFWFESGERDQQIVRARAEPAEPTPDPVRYLAGFRIGTERNARHDHTWPEDPVGDLACARVEYERELRRPTLEEQRSWAS